jgi:hypothetical protein
MKIFRIVCLVLLQGALLFGTIFADDDTVPDSATQVKFDFAQWCKVGDHTFILEKTTLADVVKTLGSGVIRFNGKDAGGGAYYVDYVCGNYIISFDCSAEMGGNDHQLEGVEVRPLGAGEKIAGLPSLRLPIAFQFGTVGMSFSDLVAALGQAKTTHGSAWYEYCGKKPIKVSSGKVLDYDVTGTLRVNVVAGKVVAIELGHVTSS